MSHHLKIMIKLLSVLLMVSISAVSSQPANTFRATVTGFDHQTMLFHFDPTSPVASAYMGLLSFPYPDQPSGPMIRTRITDDLVGKEVEVAIFGTAPDGHHRAMFFYNDNNLNHVFLVNGLAWLDFTQTKDKSFRMLQRKAQQNQVGLWAKAQPIHPLRYKKTYTARDRLQEASHRNKQLLHNDIWQTMVVAHKKKKYYAHVSCLEAAIIPFAHRFIYVRESRAKKAGYIKYPTCTDNPALK